MGQFEARPSALIQCLGVTQRSHRRSLLQKEPVGLGFYLRWGSQLSSVFLLLLVGCKCHNIRLLGGFYDLALGLRPGLALHIRNLTGRKLSQCPDATKSPKLLRSAAPLAPSLTEIPTREMPEVSSVSQARPRRSATQITALRMPSRPLPPWNCFGNLLHLTQSAAMPQPSRTCHESWQMSCMWMGCSAIMSACCRAHCGFGTLRIPGITDKRFEGARPNLLPRKFPDVRCLCTSCHHCAGKIRLWWDSKGHGLIECEEA